MDNNEIVTVHNRTSKPLTATWDGRHYDIPPYPRKIALPYLVAAAARFQNPVMGRGTPFEDWASKAEYLIGIEEVGDPLDPIEQTTAPQRWSTELVNGINVDVVRPRGGGYAPEVKQPQTPMAESGFTKP